MKREDLLELIHNGESSGVEFKRQAGDARVLAKELVAFANLEGGAVLLGVDDDGSVVGSADLVGNTPLEEWVMSVCRERIRPPLIPYFLWVRDAEPGKHVAMVRVRQGVGVHEVREGDRPLYYIRVGSQSRAPSTEELTRLLQQRRALQAELAPVSGTLLRDLDLRRIIDYLTRIRGQEAPREDDEEAWAKLLVNLEFLGEQVEEDPPAVTAGALLLFGWKPHRYLPGAQIVAMAFPGTEKDYDVRERNDLQGALVPLEGTTATVDPGLIDQALAFVRRNTVKTARIVDARRVDRWDYPEDVVREALVNALVHRDYTLASTPVELSIYSDRLEVTSPGKLPNGITVEKMRAGCPPTARNQMLRAVMQQYRYMDHMGLGVARKLVRGMKDHNGTEPDFIATEDSVTVRLWRGSSHDEL